MTVSQMTQSMAWLADKLDSGELKTVGGHEVREWAKTIEELDAVRREALEFILLHRDHFPAATQDDSVIKALRAAMAK